METNIIGNSSCCFCFHIYIPQYIYYIYRLADAFIQRDLEDNGSNQNQQKSNDMQV